MSFRAIGTERKRSPIACGVVIGVDVCNRSPFAGRRRGQELVLIAEADHP